MKTAPTHRRYIVPAAWLLTAVAAYSFGYMTNWLVSTPTASEHAAALAREAGGRGEPGSPEALAAANAARVGGQYSDAGLDPNSIQTIGQVTGGQPLEDWLKKVMAQDDPTFRMQQFMKLLEVLNNPDDIKAALKAMAENGRQGGGGGRGRGGNFMESSMLLQKLTQLDPKAALALVDEAQGGEKFMAANAVLRTMAKTDPDGALAWAKANGVQKTDGNNDGNGFPGGNDNFALAGVITQIAKTNIDKALAEASTMEMGRMGGRTADALVGEMIQQRGTEAARKAADALPAGDFKNNFIQQVASKLAADDPKGTAAWVMGMTAGDGKSQALRETVQEWTKQDAVAAGAFVTSLPVGADADSARSNYARDVAVKDVNSAISTVRAISDPQTQVRTVGQIAGTLARKDVAAGQQFVASSPITDQAKAQIVQMISAPQPGAAGGRGGPGGGFGGGGGGRRGGGGR